MPRMSDNGGSGALSHLSSTPIAVAFALIALAALVVLALLRHLFASVSASAGTR